MLILEKQVSTTCVWSIPLALFVFFKVPLFLLFEFIFTKKDCIIPGDNDVYLVLRSGLLFLLSSFPSSLVYFWDGRTVFEDLTYSHFFSHPLSFESWSILSYISPYAFLGFLLFFLFVPVQKRSKVKIEEREKLTNEPQVCGGKTMLLIN